MEPLWRFSATFWLFEPKEIVLANRRGTKRARLNDIGLSDTQESIVDIANNLRLTQDENVIVVL
jgi:hypothetical protein